MNLVRPPQGSEHSHAASGQSDWWLVFGITLFALALRLYGISAAGLWTDEAFSWWLATNHSLSEIWRSVAALEDHHPPLYYWLLHLWVVLGRNEGTLRLLSALCGALAVPTIYGIGRIIGNRDVATTAALLLSVSPFHVHYSQEARMYSLVSLGAAVSVLGQAWLLKWPELAAKPVGNALHVPALAAFRCGIANMKSLPAAAWLAYIFGSATAVWVDYPAALLPVAGNIVTLVRTRRLSNRVHFLRNWAVAQVAVVALCSPLIPLIVHQSSGPRLARFADVDPLTILGGLILDLNLLGNWYLFLALAPIELEIVAIAIGLASSAWKRDQHWLTFTLGLWLIPVAGEIIVSCLWHPVLVPRTLIWTGIPFYVMIATAIARLRKWPVYRGATLIMLLLIMSTGLIGNYWARPEYEAWRPVAEYVARSAREGDVLLFNDSYVELPFDYYFRRYHIPVIERGVPGVFGAKLTLEPVMTNADVPALLSFAHSHKRMWLIYSHNAHTDPLGLVPETLGTVNRLIEDRSFASREPIKVFLYGR